MTKRSSRGFTLIEMMVVVAILGILTTLVIVSVRSSTKPVDVSRRIGNLIEQAGRDAVRWGTVPAALAATEGSKRRTRLRAETGPVFILEVLQDAGTWAELARYTVPASVTADGYAMSVGTYTALSAAVSTNWTSFEISCFPSGSCTAATLFFSSQVGMTMDRQSRISVLPLGGATYIRRSWE